MKEETKVGNASKVQASKKVEEATSSKKSTASDVQLKCRIQAENLDEANQETIDKYVDDLVDDVCERIKAGKFDFELAKIGYDMFTDTVVYDYDVMRDILVANGYCPNCSEVFIECFSECDDCVVIRRKEKVETDMMFADYMEKYAKEEKRKAKAAAKKNGKKKQSKGEEKSNG